MGGSWDGKDYAVTECIAICVLVIIALIFETVHHHLIHSSSKVSYGVDLMYNDEIDQEDNKKPTQHNHAHHRKDGKTDKVLGADAHFHALIHRVNAELMVLGFLAFCVWSFNQAGGFEKLQENVITIAPDGASLLHLFEV